MNVWVTAVGGLALAASEQVIDNTDYGAFKECLPALGIRRIRLQGGWARTEKDPGIYDFAWLGQGKGFG